MGGKLTGKFIGRNSMGFITGHIYDLRSEIKIVYSKACICLYDKHSNAWCPYDSVESILNNWKFD